MCAAGLLKTKTPITGQFNRWPVVCVLMIRVYLLKGRAMYLHEKAVITSKIHQENEIRKVLNKVVPMVLAELEPFVGQKILKADENLVKKFMDKVGFLVSLRDSIKIKPIEGKKYANLHCLYVTATKYSIRIQVSASFNTSDHGCTYHEGTTYIGDIKNNLMRDDGNDTLEKVHKFTHLPKLSAAGEYQKYIRAKKAKDAASKARDKMWYGLRAFVS